MDIAEQAGKRRTFAIISHPDAGKTTLTEKLLLYAGAIHLAGSIKSRRASRHAVSDWMQMEQERGISITTSVLQFEHKDRVLNLLDTPGHADFSEDTYRTLAAVDSAVMLIDHSKGVEARTLKLFEVCRMRKLPVITFMNKLDREGLNPLSLVDEVSKTLNLRVAPLNWPIGMGRSFKGVIDLQTRQVTLFKADHHGAEIVESRVLSLDDAAKEIDAPLLERLYEDLELLDHAGEKFNTQDFLAGELSPAFFGSAMTNFGVEQLLDYLAEHASPPLQRETLDGTIIDPGSSPFSGFIFKIQANMNPRHRDRIAFMRVASGKFERGMEVTLSRTGETVRLAKPHIFQAQERALTEEAWPGDIVGLYDSGKLRLGDTLSVGKVLQFGGIPRFAPEHFGQLTLSDPLRRKALDTGLEELAHEGVIQLFYPAGQTRDPYLGAVGLLQFEVLCERLKNEYRVNARFNQLSYRFARWVEGPKEALDWLKERRDYILVYDRNKNPVLLCDSPWPLQYALKNAPGLILHDVEPL
jgi:peptide chain release factor 3